MRVLDALELLEVATAECKERDIDTPEIRQALDILERHCRPKWRVHGFRENLKRCEESDPGEGQQQILRIYLGGIRTSVKAWLTKRIGQLNRRYRESKDTGVKAEIDRLTEELARLSEKWNGKRVPLEPPA